MKQRKCPVCSATIAKEWMQKGAMTIVACESCTMKYAVNEDVIPVGYYETQGDSFYVSEEKVKGDYNAERYRREVAFLAKHCSSGKILDVGCSTGGFMSALAGEFPGRYDLHGSDVAPAAREVARAKGFSILEGDLSAAGLERGPFDAITFWAVLEHLIDPKQHVMAAQKALKKGGLVFAVVPNVKSLAIRILGNRYRYVLPEHLNYFSAKTLSRLFDAGFSPVEAKTSYFNPFVIAQDAFRKAAPSQAERAQLLNRTNRMKQKAAAPLKAAYRLSETVLGGFGLADNIIAVFRKR